MIFRQKFKRKFDRKFEASQATFHLNKGCFSLNFHLKAKLRGGKCLDNVYKGLILENFHPEHPWKSKTSLKLLISS